MTFTFADSMEWWLEIPSNVQAEAWEQSQIHGTPNRRWTAYLNQLCLNILLPWIQAEISPTAQSEFANVSPALWELVNGTAIALDQSTRIILLPGEAIDNGELEIPQEWVDIPNWAADYYVGVQVNLGQQPNESWLRIWGYTTHQDLKNHGNCDLNQRMYYLDEQFLVHDMNSLWVSYEACLEQPAKAAIAPLAGLASEQAEGLIQRLGSPALTFPRLAVPFSLWGALLEQPHWRRELCRHRQLIVPAPIQLQQWLGNIVESGWQSLETLFGSTPTLALSFRETVDTIESEVTQIKQVNWSKAENPPILLVVGLKPEEDGRTRVLVQIHSNQSGDFVPFGLTLSLCSETGEVLQTIQARDRDSYIQLQFRCTPETDFSLQILLDNDSFIEAFTL